MTRPKFASPPGRCLDLFGWGVLLVVLWLTMVSLPWPANDNLDASWQTVLVYAHAHGWKFGTQVIFTWGPWGYLCSVFHLGALGSASKLAWESIGKLSLALALLRLVRDLPLCRRILFVCAWVVLTDYVLDVSFLLLILLTVTFGLMRRDANAYEWVAWTLLLAGCGQLKFTYTLITAIGTVMAAGVWFARQRPAKAVAIIGLYSGLWFLGWLAAGQGPGNLLPYIKRSLEISAGYSDAMGLDESRAVFVLAAMTMVFAGLFVLQVWLMVKERAFAWGSAVFLAGVWLLVWKEAIVRGDDHVFALFFFTIIAAIVLPALFFPGKRLPWFESVVLICVIGSIQVSPTHFWGVIRLAPGRLVKSAVRMTHLAALPRKWSEEFKEAAAAAALPVIDRTVGTGTIDVVNFRQSAALLNGLNYTPRPVIQSYTAYTPGLAGCNLRFYQSPRAPDFILWNGNRVDNRFPSLDDNFLWEAWFGHYLPVVHEGDFWLLKRTTESPLAVPQHRPLIGRTLTLGETLDLPDGITHPVGAIVDAIPSVLGKVRALVYKPALINLVTTETSGETHVWRLIPGVAKAGFLLSPLAVTDREFASLFHHAGHRWVKTVSFAAPPGEEKYWKKITVQLYEIPSLSLGSPLAEWTERGIVATAPRELGAGAPPEFFTIQGRAVAQLHAPGFLVLSIPPGARRFRGEFGLREGAYTGEGHTDGVEFSVEVARGQLPPRTVWKRYLDPVVSAGDRGLQQFDVALPADAGGTLTVHTGAGPAGDNRWDWAIVSQLRFDNDQEPAKSDSE